MAKKVSKNQRTNRVAAKEGARNMAKVVAAVKKDNGQYSFRMKMVPAENLQDELKNVRS